MLKLLIIPALLIIPMIVGFVMEYIENYKYINIRIKTKPIFINFCRWRIDTSLNIVKFLFNMWLYGFLCLCVAIIVIIGLLLIYKGVNLIIK